MNLIVLTVVMAALAPAIPAAQGPGGGRGQRPPRDPVRAAERTGTASISGRVLTADTNRPLKRARVMVSLAGPGRPRGVLTDDAGRYRVAALPAGTYTISASKGGFIDGAFGQRRALRSGTRIELAEGQQLANVDLALARGAVITGHILDEDGEPLARTNVQVLRYQYQRGERRLAPVGADQSDDRGQYRIFGLPRGEYIVTATAPLEGGLRRGMGNRAAEAAASDDAPPATGYAPTYYPGVITAAEAAPVRVAPAQELTGIDFQLRLVPLATVRGTTADPRGFVVLVAEDGTGAVRMQGLRAPVLQDGSFSVMNVPPGKYVAVARTEGSGAAATAMQSLVVSGEDVMISLTPIKGARLGGAITLESAETPRPGAFRGFRISAQPIGAAFVVPRSNRPAYADDAGRFTLDDLLPGQYVIDGTGIRGWTIKSVYLDGQDVTDRPIEIKGDNADGLNVIFTDKISGLSGTVSGEGGTPAAGTTVIAFASDDKLWRPQTRRIQTAPTDQNGAYRFANLPPGEYLLVVTDDIEQGEWFDPVFLESVRHTGVRITLAEGEQKIHPLKAS